MTRKLRLPYICYLSDYVAIFSLQRCLVQIELRDQVKVGRVPCHVSLNYLLHVLLFQEVGDVIKGILICYTIQYL